MLLWSAFFTVYTLILTNDKVLKEIWHTKCHIIYLDSYVTTEATKTKSLLIKCVVMSTAIDGASARTFVLGAVPLAMFASTGK